MRICSVCAREASTVYREGGKFYCTECKQYMPSNGLVKDSRRNYVVNSDEWVNGVYEHITDHPITITGGKAELRAVCEKHGVMARALLKPKSRGKGYEMR